MNPYEEHLLSIVFTTHANLWEQASQTHPFLRGCTDGTLPASNFNTWLVQDRLYGQAFVKLLQHMATQSAQRAEDKALLAGGCAGAEEDLQWFARTAEERGVDLSAPPLPQTQVYTAFLVAMEEEPFALQAAVVYLIEKVLLPAVLCAVGHHPPHLLLRPHPRLPSGVPGGMDARAGQGAGCARRCHVFAHRSHVAYLPSILSPLSMGRAGRTVRTPPSQSGYVFVVSPTWPLLIPHVLLPLLLHEQWSGDAFRANVDALGAMAAAAAAAGGIVPSDWETRVNAYFQQVSALLSSFMAPRVGLGTSRDGLLTPHALFTTRRCRLLRQVMHLEVGFWDMATHGAALV
jgi:thiaminase